jgi:MoaA/NifB/PqqE/SkfB family radical SAM enzyme
MERLNILYRGPLVSCNYDCHYCPFAKRQETAAELQQDRQCLERFSSWLTARNHRPIGLLFTPWGEALVRKWYRDVIVDLSKLAHIQRVAVQTNLSCKLDWLATADLSKVALWCTFHPDQVALDRFLIKCEQLIALGVRFSVGAVGLPNHQTLIAQLREQLPQSVYLWINAYKSSKEEIAEEVLNAFQRIDPLFPVNNTYHPSAGRDCNAGWSTISVDGAGNVQRCHFIKTVLGNVYREELEQMLVPRVCTNTHCGCHIGYVHMPHLELDKVYGDNILERIPQDSFNDDSSASLA